MPPSCCTMFERWITALHSEEIGEEPPAATRERLRDRFPKNATRRMTQLGLLLGSVLEPLRPAEDDVLVYASGYAETRALEAYLDSFPTPSPTLFQTSIHPSAVQQSFITHQRPLREFLPVTGGAHLPAQALLAALLSDAPRVLLCGGEERGTWLLEQNRASSRAFAFALALSRDPGPAPLAQITLTFPNPSAPPPPAAPSSVALPPGLCPPASGLCPPASGLRLDAFFDLLHQRRPFDADLLPGRRLRLHWSP